MMGPGESWGRFREASGRVRDRLRDERSTSLSHEFGAAPARDRCSLHFQPHLDLVTMRISGAEALIGWNHPLRGVVFADDVIPFENRVERSTGIGSWALRETIAAAGILREVDPDFRLYFNLSSMRLEEDSCIEQIVDAANAGAPLDNMGIEITETAALRDPRRMLRLVSVIREHGMHVAIDDFGAGASARSLVRTFPPNIVKVDRRLVHGDPEDRYDAAFIESVAAIGKRVGFSMLADRVEDEDQLAWLGENGCRYVQGRAFCPPLPLDVFLVWLCARSIV
jgi:EAL domain-containing protein (putative c-di-GMP-specific phosphodiesterase class I)